MHFSTLPVYEALRAPLTLIEDETKRLAIERYLEAARFPLERAVFDVLAALVATVNEQSDGARVRLSYQPGGLEVEVEARQPAEPSRPLAGEWLSADADMEKVTIRIPAELKDLATQAASNDGLSANSWFVRALAGALRGAIDQPARGGPDRRPPGRRFDDEPNLDRRGRHGGKGNRLQGWIGE